MRIDVFVGTQCEFPLDRPPLELSNDVGLRGFPLVASEEEVPAYVVFNDRTLAELVARTPRTLAELAAVPGIGPAKLERYGAELLSRLAELAA